MDTIIYNSHSDISADKSKTSKQIINSLLVSRPENSKMLVRNPQVL